MEEKILKLIKARQHEIEKLTETESSNVQFAAIGKAMTLGGIECIELETNDIIYVIEALIDFVAYDFKMIEREAKKNIETRIP